jgi:serine/threonine-protein kinase RsbW
MSTLTLNPPQERKLVIASKSENMLLVENFVEQLQEEYRVKEDVYGNIVIAVTEAVNNAIMHGNKENPDKNVSISARLLNPFLLTITVQDEGNGFNVDDLPDPTLPENILSDTGRGVYIIKEICDNVEYSRNGTTVTMQFNI